MRVRKNNILVKPIEEDPENGLFIPPLFKAGMQDTKLGKVVFNGPNTPVKKDDVVVFGKWSGEEISYHGVQLLLIKSNQITAIK